MSDLLETKPGFEEPLSDSETNYSSSGSTTLTASSSTASFLDTAKQQTESSSSSSTLASSPVAASASSSTASLAIPAHRHLSHFIHKHEVPRKVFHSSIGFLTLWLYTQGIQFSQVTPVLMALFFIIFTTDFLRFRNAKLNKLYCTFLGPLMREREVNQSYNGVIWYLLGLVIVFSLFPKDVSLMSVLLLSWADTAASTVGRAYGHLTPRISSRKSLAGSLASFATGVVSAAILYQYFIPHYAQWNAPGDIMWTPETSNIPLWLLMLLAGLVGAVSEAIDVYDIDDNFTIPVLSAFFMWPVIKLGAKI